MSPSEQDDRNHRGAGKGGPTVTGKIRRVEEYMGALHTTGERLLGHGIASAMMDGIEQEEIRCIVDVYKDIVELYQPSMNTMRVPLSQQEPRSLDLART